MGISDRSSDGCSSEVDEVGAVGPLDAAHLHPPLEDVGVALLGLDRRLGLRRADEVAKLGQEELVVRALAAAGRGPALDKGFDGRLGIRSEEHKSELQSLMRNASAVYCLIIKI